MLALKKERGILKAQFTRKVKIFRKSVSKEDHVEVVQDLMKEVNSIFGKLEKNNDDIVELAEEESDIENSNIYISECEDTKVECQDLWCKYKDTCSKSKSQKDNIQFSVKKLAAPDFAGERQLYPTFKNDFIRLMEPRYGEDNFVLRSCLSESVIKSLIWTDDYKTNWERLDQKYGSTPKIVDYVVHSIKNLKPVTEGNNHKLIEMINVIERGWFDLKRLDKESEIENEVIISHIERLLPMNLMREWALKRRKLIDVNDTFNIFLDILINDRDTLEYMDQIVRKITPNVKSNVNIVNNENENNANNVDTYQSNEYVKLLTTFQEQQTKQNQMFNDSLYNLSSMINNLTVKQPSASSESNYNSKFCVLHNSQSHNLVECITFKRMNYGQRVDFIRKNRICFSCLYLGHVSAHCRNRKLCDVRDNNGNICNKNHHPLMHEYPLNSGAQALYQYNSVSNVASTDIALLPIAYIYCHSYPISTLYDSGADLSLITHNLANKLGLNGYEVELNIIKVGNVAQKVKSKCYKLLISDLNGISHEIKVFGLDQITSNQICVNIDNVAKMFQINPNLIERPQGPVELLIGIDNCYIMPQVVRCFDNLQLLKNSFGYCIRGIIPGSSNQINIVKFHINHIVCTSSDITKESHNKFVKNFEDFYTVDFLGTECSPKCGQWLQCVCGNCSFGNKFSVQEQRELDLIEKGLNYDSPKINWTVTYPWIKDPNMLPNNYRTTLSKLISTECRLNSLGDEYVERYDNQIRDMINRQTATKISKTDVEKYKGPIHFLSHHEIHNPKSSSTPLRIVFNPSASFKGHILNDYYAKGPDLLNDMLGIFLRFRMGKVCIMGDIQKMYNSIYLSLLDQFTHLFLWRNMVKGREPDIYKINRVSFWDKPAGAIAILALKKTAEMFNHTYNEACNIIKNDSYVDDIIFSEENISIADSRKDEIKLILKEGSYQLKAKSWAATFALD